MFVSFAADLRVRHAAGGDDHDIRVLRQHRFGVRPGVELELHPESFALRHAPVDDAHHLLAANVLRGQADLAAGIVHRFEHDDLMPALARHARGFETPGPRAHDDDLALRRGRLDRLRQLEFATSRGVVNAQRHAALIDAIETVVRADTRPDIVLPALDDLA